MRILSPGLTVPPATRPLNPRKSRLGRLTIAPAWQSFAFAPHLQPARHFQDAPKSTASLYQVVLSLRTVILSPANPDMEYKRRRYIEIGGKGIEIIDNVVEAGFAEID